MSYYMAISVWVYNYLDMKNVSVGTEIRMAQEMYITIFGTRPTFDLEKHRLPKYACSIHVNTM